MIFRTRACLTLLALLVSAGPVAASSASGSPLRLVLAEAGADPVAVRVELAMEGAEIDPLQVEATAPGLVRLTPPSEGPWTVRAVAEGYWSEPLILNTAAEPAPTLTLWPEVRLRGRVSVPKGYDLPVGMAARLHQQERQGRLPRIEATMLCPLDEEGRLDCALPAAKGLDLRLRSPGFASRFYWDLDLSESSGHDLGRLSLRPGASVVGRVEVPTGYELGEVVVRLEPTRASTTTPPGQEERVQRQAGEETSVDERGFFSLEGLSAGAYGLEVTHPDLAEHRIGPLRVIDGGQTEVADPIMLDEPVPLRLILDPPFDPFGGDWEVLLYRKLPSGQKGRVFGERDLVAKAGFLDVPSPPGEYEVRILDSRGARLSTEEVVADGTGAPQVLTIEPIRVEGEVTLGDEPLLARITFRGESTWTMDADLEGRFGGYLPRAGDWDVAVEAIEPPVERRTRALPVELDEGEDRAFLRLRLPDTRLRGTVVNEIGTPVPGAEVTLVDPLLTGRQVAVETDEDGEFDVRALDEGEVQAQAVFVDEEGAVWSSRPEVTRLTEDETAVVNLVLRPHQELRGRVVAADGNPVPQAWIEVAAFDAAGRLDVPVAQPFASDAAGRFVISLPASIETVHLTVMAPGRPLTQVEVVPGPVGELTLPPSGGSLVLNLPGQVDEIPWADPTRPRPGLVNGNGVKFAIGPLSQWSSLNGHPWQREAGELTLPMLAPGRYAVCWLTARDWLLLAAPGRDCIEAAVEPGRAVRIQLPSQPH